jgi:hypothetical protein
MTERIRELMAMRLPDVEADLISASRWELNAPDKLRMWSPIDNGSRTNGFVFVFVFVI